jgi:hypothetical protein
VIEFATEVCGVDPLDVVVEVLGKEVDQVAVEVGEDPVLDDVVEVIGEEVDDVAVEVGKDPVLGGVVEVLGCGARAPVAVTARASVAVAYPGAEAVIVIVCVPGMMMLFQLVCRSPKGSV